MSVQKEQILEALAAIVDPDLHRDIVSLGFVKDISIEGGNVAFTIELTTPACPVKDRFRSEAERLVMALPEVETVKVNLTSRQQAGKAAGMKSGLSKVKQIIAVASCKGGVGKSTVAAALAKELARRGYRTGLLDTDLFGPSVPVLFGLHKPELKQAGNEMILPVDADGLAVMSYGFWLGDAPAVMRGPMVTQYVNQFLHNVEWGELDYLVMDLPPGTGDIQLTITQSVQLDGAVIVTTPQTLSIADVGKGILMFEKVNVPVLGVIENMAWFVCDSCSTRHAIFGEDGTRKLAERFGLEILAQLPLSPKEYGGSFAGKMENPAVSDATDAVIRSLGRHSVGNAKPEVSFDEEAISLAWENGEEWTVGNRELRASCRCAVCEDEFTGELLLDEAGIREDIRAEQVSVIGNYALAIKWNDGHASGIYPYSRIRELAGVTGAV